MSASTLVKNTQTPIVLFGPELSSAFGLDLVSDEYRNEFLQNISELILEQSLLSYFSEIDNESQSVFESWIMFHKQQDDFLVRIRKTYPDFVTILEEEIIKFKREAFRIGVDEK